MKKLYATIALATALTFSATAAQRQTATLSLPTAKAELNIADKATLRADIKLEQTTLRKAPAAKAPAAEALEKEYVWGYYGLLNGDSGEKTSAAAIVANEDGTLTIGLPAAGTVIPLAASYDAATGRITIANNQHITEDSDGDVNFYFKAVDPETGDVADGMANVESTYGIVNEDATLIQFDPNYAWALGDPKNEKVGWYFFRALNQFYVENWELLGTGKFNDSILSIEGITSSVVDVEVYQNETSIKVVDPLKGIYAQIGLDGTSPDMILDVTDPDNVLLPMTATGFGTQTAGAYYYFGEAWYNEQGDDAPGAGATEESLRIKKTEKDGKLRIDFGYQSCTMYTAGDKKFYYACNDAANLPYIEVAFNGAGVEGVSVADENAPVEYFNLQGVRIENPAAGVVIRRQGNKVTKMLVK